MDKDTHTHTYICRCTHTLEYYSAINKYKIMLFLATWMDLENIILGEMSDRERQISYDITFTWNLRNKTSE